MTMSSRSYNFQREYSSAAMRQFGTVQGSQGTENLPKGLGTSASSDERAIGRGDRGLDEACFHACVRG